MSGVLRLKASRVPKYHAKRIECDGQKFDSLAEYRRWQQLVNLERAGFVRDLQRQVSFVLAPEVKYSDAKRAIPALRYVADFQYFDVSSGRPIVEDVKGIKTQAYKIKRHLMMTVYHIEVKEITAR